jgi:hypothetical protein
VCHTNEKSQVPQDSRSWVAKKKTGEDARLPKISWFKLKAKS